MRYLAPILILLLGMGALTEPAAAQPNRARQGVRSGEVRSLDQILNGIRRERPGNLADVQGPNAGPSGEPHYRLKWLTPDGRVLWLDTDARTGRVLGVQGEDRPGPRALPPQGNFRPREQGFAPRGNFLGPPRPPAEANVPPPETRYNRGPVPVEPRGGLERGPGRFQPPVRGPVGPGPGPTPRSGYGRNGR